MTVFAKSETNQLINFDAHQFIDVCDYVTLSVVYVIILLYHITLLYYIVLFISTFYIYEFYKCFTDYIIV